MENPARIREVRKAIARGKTVLRERELELTTVIERRFAENDERNQRKVYSGRVVSDKMDKTITCCC